MNPPWVYMCSPSWTPLPPPSPSHPSGSSQCTSPKHPVSCIKPGLVIHFTYDNIHVSMPFSQIIPPSPSATESKRLFCASVSLLLSHIQGRHYHLSKFQAAVTGTLKCSREELPHVRGQGQKPGGPHARKAVAKRSYPMSEVRGSGRECQTAMVQEQSRGATPRPRLGGRPGGDTPRP